MLHVLSPGTCGCCSAKCTCTLQLQCTVTRTLVQCSIRSKDYSSVVHEKSKNMGLKYVYELYL